MSDYSQKQAKTVITVLVALVFGAVIVGGFLLFRQSSQTAAPVTTTSVTVGGINDPGQPSISFVSQSGELVDGSGFFGQMPVMQPTTAAPAVPTLPQSLLGSKLLASRPKLPGSQRWFISRWIMRPGTGR